MKSRESGVRLKLFQVREKRRQLAQLTMMTKEFERMTIELDNQIRVEEEKSGVKDQQHFAYPTFASAARQRRDNLLTSIRDLTMQKEHAEKALFEFETELERARALEQRDGKVLPLTEDVAFTQRRSMIG